MATAGVGCKALFWTAVAETDQSLSELVNSAVRRSLLEDAEDLTAFDERAHEPSLDFGAVVKDLKKRGKL